MSSAESDITVEEYLQRQLEQLIKNLETHGAEKIEKFKSESKKTRRELEEALMSM